MQTVPQFHPRSCAFVRTVDDRTAALAKPRTIKQRAERMTACAVQSPSCPPARFVPQKGTAMATASVVGWLHRRLQTCALSL